MAAPSQIDKGRLVRSRRTGVYRRLLPGSQVTCCVAAIETLTFLRLTPLRVVCFCSHHVAVALAGPGRGAAWGVQPAWGEWRRLTMAYGNDKSISQASAKGKVKW